MCSPELIVGTTQAVGAVYEYAQGNLNADASERYQNRLYRANKNAADSTARLNYGELANAYLQENAAAAQAVDEVVRQAAEARGTAVASAGATGSTGDSVDALYRDFTRQELNNLTTANRNQAFSLLRFRSQAESVRLNQQAAILGALPQPVSRPTLGGLGLKLIGIGAGGAADYLKTKPL